jgi:hypothetical protein
MTRCGTNDLHTCFGSDQIMQPEMNTETYVVYTLESDNTGWNYGLENRNTGELYYLTLP